MYALVAVGAVAVLVLLGGAGRCGRRVAAACSPWSGSPLPWVANRALEVAVGGQLARRPGLGRGQRAGCGQLGRSGPAGGRHPRWRCDAASVEALVLVGAAIVARGRRCAVRARATRRPSAGARPASLARRRAPTLGALGRPRVRARSVRRRPRSRSLRCSRRPRGDAGARARRRARRAAAGVGASSTRRRRPAVGRALRPRLVRHPAVGAGRSPRAASWSSAGAAAGCVAALGLLVTVPGVAVARRAIATVDDLFADLADRRRGRPDRPERRSSSAGGRRDVRRAPWLTRDRRRRPAPPPSRWPSGRRATVRRASSEDASAADRTRPRRLVVEVGRLLRTSSGSPVDLAVYEVARERTCVRRGARPASLVAVSDSLVVRGAREHNLKNIAVELPRDQLIVFTGLSGSGKSSLAFDTIYAEGQRRYVESLSSYARQFLGQMDKPDVDFIEGLSPGHLDRPEVGVPQPALHRRHDHRGLRLPPAALRPHRRAALPRVRRPDHAPDAAADRRPHPRAPRGHPLPGAGPGRARPQGHLRDAAHRPRRPGLRPGPHRRRGPRAHRQGRPGPLRAAHDRGRRRPARRAGRPRAPAHRLARDGAPAGRRRGRGAARPARR